MLASKLALTALLVSLGSVGADRAEAADRDDGNSETEVYLTNKVEKEGKVRCTFYGIDKKNLQFRKLASAEPGQTKVAVFDPSQFVLYSTIIENRSYNLVPSDVLRRDQSIKPNEKFELICVNYFLQSADDRSKVLVYRYAIDTNFRRGKPDDRPDDRSDDLPDRA